MDAKRTEYNRVNYFFARSKLSSANMQQDMSTDSKCLLILKSSLYNSWNMITMHEMSSSLRRRRASRTRLCAALTGSSLPFTLSTTSWLSNIEKRPLLPNTRKSQDKSITRSETSGLALMCSFSPLSPKARASASCPSTRHWSPAEIRAQDKANSIDLSSYS